MTDRVQGKWPFEKTRIESGKREGITNYQMPVLRQVADGLLFFSPHNSFLSYNNYSDISDKSSLVYSFSLYKTTQLQSGGITFE